MTNTQEVGKFFLKDLIYVDFKRNYKELKIMKGDCMKSSLCRVFKKGLLIFMIVNMCLFNVPVSGIAEIVEEKEASEFAKEINSIFEEQKTGEVANPEIKNAEVSVTDEVAEFTPTEIELDDAIANSNLEIDLNQGSSEKAVTTDQEEGSEFAQEISTLFEEQKKSKIEIPAMDNSDVSETGEDSEIIPDQVEFVDLPAEDKLDSELNLENSETDVLDESTVAKGDEIDADDAIDGMTMLYIGGAIGVVAIGVLALSGGSSGSSDSGTVEPDPTPVLPDPASPAIGPDLNGNWSGYLHIKDTGHEGHQNISADISHSGSSVDIITTSTLDYGRRFSGTISSSGYMLVYDADRGEDWTTHYGNATTRQIDLYDYVNHFEDLDRMYLSR